MANLVGLDERIDYLKRKGYKVATFEEMKTEPAPPGGWDEGDDYRAWEVVYDPQGRPVAPHDAWGEPLSLNEQWAEAFFLHGRKGKKGYISLWLIIWSGGRSGSAYCLLIISNSSGKSGG